MQFIPNDLKFYSLLYKKNSLNLKLRSYNNVILHNKKKNNLIINLYEESKNELKEILEYYDYDSENYINLINNRNSFPENGYIIIEDENIYSKYKSLKKYLERGKFFIIDKIYDYNKEIISKEEWDYISSFS